MLNNDFFENDTISLPISIYLVDICKLLRNFVTLQTLQILIWKISKFFCLKNYSLGSKYILPNFILLTVFLYKYFDKDCGNSLICLRP